MNLREKLGKYYKLDGELPRVVSQEMFEDYNLASSAHESEQNDDRAILSQVFKDPRINLNQRERIATSILVGNYAVGAALPDREYQKSSLTVHDTDMARAVAHMQRHKAQNPGFLQIQAEPLAIQALDVKNVLRNETLRKKYSTCRKNGFVWANHYIPAAREMIYKCPSSTETQLEREKHISTVEATMLARKVALDRSKGEHVDLKREAERMKLREKEEFDKKLETKRQLSLFRKKLRKRLVERNDPRLGEIMRNVNDNVALQFMERYKGYTMSIDAVLALIGTSVTSKTVGPDVEQFFNEEIYTSTPSSPTHDFGNSRILSRLSRGFLGSPGGGGENDCGPRLDWNAALPTMKKFGCGFQVRTAADTFEVVDMRPLTGGSANYNDSYYHKDVGVDGRDLDTSSLLGITAVRDQMIAEGTLPSRQVEKVLPDEAMERLGTHRSSFNKIAKEVLGSHSGNARDKTHGHGGGRRPSNSTGPLEMMGIKKMKSSSSAVAAVAIRGGRGDCVNNTDSLSDCMNSLENLSMGEDYQPDELFNKELGKLHQLLTATDSTQAAAAAAELTSDHGFLRPVTPGAPSAAHAASARQGGGDLQLYSPNGPAPSDNCNSPIGNFSTNNNNNNNNNSNNNTHSHNISAGQSHSHNHLTGSSFNSNSLAPISAPNSPFPGQAEDHQLLAPITRVTSAKELRAPRALKTKDLVNAPMFTGQPNVDHSEMLVIGGVMSDRMRRNASSTAIVIDGNKLHPPSPYAAVPGHLPEGQAILSSGVPAGAGLPLWTADRIAHITAKTRLPTGRWRVGSAALQDSSKKPFISIT